MVMICTRKPHKNSHRRTKATPDPHASTASSEHEYRCLAATVLGFIDLAGFHELSLGLAGTEEWRRYGSRSTGLHDL